MQHLLWSAASLPCPGSTEHIIAVSAVLCITANLAAQCPLWVMCGRRLIDKSFLTLMQYWSVRSCVRPVDAARMAAGPNALRGSDPNRKHAFKDAMTQAGSPDPRNDRFCITSLCPRQFLMTFCLLSAAMPAATSAP